MPCKQLIKNTLHIRLQKYPRQGKNYVIHGFFHGS